MTQANAMNGAVRGVGSQVYAARVCLVTLAGLPKFMLKENQQELVLTRLKTLLAQLGGEERLVQ
jgi:hypothetical protein